MHKIRKYIDNNLSKLRDELNLMRATRNILLDQEKKLFKTHETIMNKYFAISIYTCWETFVQKFMFYLLSDYSDILFDKILFKKYLNSAFEKNYHKKRFLETFLDEKTEIIPEILFSSNNMTLSEVKKLITRLSFDYNRLRDKINKDSLVITELKRLDDLGIYPTLKNEKAKKPFDKVEGYIQLLVEVRNDLSHNYGQFESYSIDQMLSLINFVECIQEIFIDFSMLEVIYRGLAIPESFIKVEVYKIEKSNSKKDKYSLISINMPSNYTESSVKSIQSLIISDADSEADLLLVDNWRKSETIPGVYTIRASSDYIIKKRKTFNLYIYEQVIRKELNLEISI